MTRLFDVNLGKMDEFHRVLAGQGMTAEMIDMIVKDPIRLSGLVDDLKALQAQRRNPYSELFENDVVLWETFFTRLSMQNWSFTPQQVSAFHDRRPQQHSTLDDVIVPFAWLGNFDDTYREQLAWLDDTLPTDGIRAKLRRPHRVQFMYTYRHGLPKEPTLYWISLNGLRKREAPSRKASVSLPISNLAALSLPVLHPRWMAAMAEGNSDVAQNITMRALRYSPWGRMRGNPQKVLVMSARHPSIGLYSAPFYDDATWSNGDIDGKLL